MVSRTLFLTAFDLGIYGESIVRTMFSERNT